MSTIKPENTEPGDASAASDPGDAGALPPNGGSQVPVRSAEFAELDSVPTVAGTAALNNLLEVSVSVTAELGRTTTSIGQLLKLNVGSVVELERLVSDPVDLVAQGVRLARGEVVIVEDRFAIRIQEIVDPRKRA